MKYILKWVAIGAVIFFLPQVVRGIQVENLYTAVIVAIVLALLNITVKPVLVILTLPVTILTLGLFLFVINALVLQFAGTIVKGFSVDGFGAAFLGALIISVVSWVAEKVLKNR